MLNLDIFCEVIDNYGDIGFAYRLAKALQKRLNSQIRLFFDVLTQPKLVDLNPGIEILTYADAEKVIPAKVVLQIFASPLPIKYQEKIQDGLLINVDYLLSEAWTGRYHQKESFLADNLKRYFFMPGFTADTGGLLLDTENKFKDRKQLAEYLKITIPENVLLGTFFAYENSAKALALAIKQPAYILDFVGKEYLAIGQVKIFPVDFMPQEYYDSLLLSADFNLVRGEDSLIRAVLAGKPLLWQAYREKDNYHLEKIRSFLNMLTKHCPDSKSAQEFQDVMLAHNTTHSEYAQFIQNLTGWQKMTEDFALALNKNGDLADNLIGFIKTKI